MCLISLAWGTHPQYPLVLASNRDEFYDRPTAPLSAWQTRAGHTVVSGRDLRDGGTWIGFSPEGRFACLTNVRAPALASPAARSRGALAVSWLTSDCSPTDWVNQVEASAYAGFNLIVGDWRNRSCLYISNMQAKSPEVLTNNAKAAIEFIAIEQPILQPITWQSMVSLSNAALNTPWPKTQRLQAAMAGGLELTGHPNIQGLQRHLHTALMNTAQAPQADLPCTGVPADMELALSSVFVRYPLDTPQYGTRSSLVAVLDAGDTLHLQETTHTGRAGGVVNYNLAW